MRRTWIRITSACWLLVVAGSVSALDRKAGLWELTTTLTWQQSPFGAGAPAGGGPYTTLVCFTQQQIEKYGAIVPPLHPGCQIGNVVKKADGMTADMVCTGKMSGKATLESSWTDAEHAKGAIHFIGSVQAEGRNLPVEWTSESSSVFKGAACGDVKPFPMPEH